jgi:threonine synthase
MKYISTRGAWSDAPRPFREVLLEGLAPDGGLAVPRQYPRLTRDDLARMRGLDYRGLAFEVVSRFTDDIAPEHLRRIVDATYTAATFGSDEITPLVTLEPGFHLLELSNGPTLAFKDIALQLLGRLFEHVLAADGSAINILGATSGDTGSSAEYAMHGRRGIAVFMLSPRGRMSPFQQAQMYSLIDPVIHNVAVDGTFDDCQDIVKTIAGDASFKREYRIGAVNSINWARVAAQVVYYFKGYFAATGGDDERVQFAVPSGNFGNVLAGHVAREMGLPIARLIVATNENDVLDEFFRRGRYRPRPTKETHATSSPSMDISKASNFERYLFDVVGRDANALAALWQRLARDGGIDLKGTPLWQRVLDSGFTSGRSNHATRIATIRDVERRFGRVIDPHTADGVKVGLERRDPSLPLVCLETALPAKFAATIREALGRMPERPAGFEGLEARTQRFDVMPPDVERVKAYIARHARGR